MIREIVKNEFRNHEFVREFIPISDVNTKPSLIFLIRENEFFIREIVKMRKKLLTVARRVSIQCVHKQADQPVPCRPGYVSGHPGLIFRTDLCTGQFPSNIDPYFVTVVRVLIHTTLSK